MNGHENLIEQRLNHLESHLRQENPILVSAVESFKELDQVGRSMGLLTEEESYVTQISWWPMISVLGTFSAGKSTFINYTLGYKLQRTGNQAVDDKFTVVCYSPEKEVHVLPGVALNADPRFPFFDFSQEIEKVAKGEGNRIDAYLQLKGCPSDRLKGKILIDSPGFDADDQRTATLRITKHIIDVSDLVLIFFDARHPEAGAMRDTLDHLVRQVVKHPEAGKFLYILNQVDTSASEDNLEEIVAAWQRALAQPGVTTGRFYCIYSPDIKIQVEDEVRKQRYETRRKEDLGEIYRRVEEVSVERAYRIVNSLGITAHHIRDDVVPQLRELKAMWRNWVFWLDGIAIGLVLAAVGGLFSLFGMPNWHDSFGIGVLVTLAVVAGGIHLNVRSLSARIILRKAEKKLPPGRERAGIINAFRKNTSSWNLFWGAEPIGWNEATQKRLRKIGQDANRYIQLLNDQFTSPSGKSHDSPAGQKSEETIETPAP